MKAQNQPFTRRQIMLKNQYEIYRYHDAHLSEVALHHHDFYECISFAPEGWSTRWRAGATPAARDILLTSPQELHQPIFPEPGEAYERAGALDQPGLFKGNRPGGRAGTML